MGMRAAASRLGEVGLGMAMEDSLLSLAALPAPAPADPPIRQQRLSFDTPKGMEQFIRSVIDANRHRVTASWAGTREAAPSPAVEAADAPEITHAAFLDLTKRSDETGTSIGSGALKFFARNGTLLSQMPFTAPLVPRSVLEQELLPMKLASAGAASTEFVNMTTPTVKLSDTPLPVPSVKICRPFPPWG